MLSNLSISCINWCDGHTFGSLEILGILKEAMVDMLRVRGIAGYIRFVGCKQGLRGRKLRRLLDAIVERRNLNAGEEIKSIYEVNWKLQVVC